MQEFQQSNGTASDVAPIVRDESVVRLEERIEQLKSRLHLAVIFGGDKSAPETVLFQSISTRPWKSYESVAADIAASLQTLGFRHVHLMPEDKQLPDRLRREGIQLAWLNTGGVQGYNPTAHAPAVLEMLGIPYVGHDPLASTMLDNKHVFKHKLVSAGIPTAPFCTWQMTRGAFRPEINSRFYRAFGDYPGPFVVKPVSGRASLHVQHVVNRSELSDAVDAIYRSTKDLVLIEKFLPGREFCIAAAGRVVSRAGTLARRHNPFTFAILERVLGSDEKIFTSMDVRSITADRFRPVDDDQSELPSRMHRLAREIFFEFDLQSLIRIDLRADENGKLFVLEANPKPDLKRSSAGVTSLICGGLARFGMDYEDLIISLLADRLDFLFTHRPETIAHITDLLVPCQHQSNAELPRAAPATTDIGDSSSPKSGADRPRATNFNNVATEINLHALNAIKERMLGATSSAQLGATNEPLAKTVPGKAHRVR
jgi:D-alanine-D-alanine ligase